MSPETLGAVRPLSSFPRVSGDEPTTEVRQIAADAFSPRERG